MKAKIIKVSILFCLMTISSLVFIVCKGSEHSSATDLSTQSELQLEQILINAHIPQYHFDVVKSYAHDTHSFTEGLILEKDYAYESTGLYGRSKLRKIDIRTGKVLQEYSLPAQYFAEGLTAIGDQLYQLTYREHIGFVYDKNSFQVKNKFSYQNEGWGLTTDGQQLIMSNGTSTLSFIDPRTLKTVRTVAVTVNASKISSINELEYINGMIYANVWPTSLILLISPENGKVEGWMNIKILKPASSCMECVANGIAYDEQDKVLVVTGKNWPYLYAIKLSREIHGDASGGV